MRSYSTNTLNIKERHISPFLVFNVSIYILSAICFMIYTTQQSYTFAEGDEDLGYDISSVDASVTVGTACTFTGTVTSPHTATIANGINSTDIGTTVLDTKCNDSGGYALYAIGYTGDEYGATDLTYTSLDGTTTNSDYNITTGTATSGNTSNWSMKLSPVAGTTTATIDNGYDNYNIVPDDYTKVATLNTVTDSVNVSTPTGSSVSTTYQAYISPTQPAGTYTGKVKYTLVHPSTAPAPEKPMTIEQAYQKSGATKTAQGYYRMQDMNSNIANRNIIEGDSIQIQDIRDDKIYWATKMKDGNIWMTQNLDLDIEASRTYTSADTDLAYSSIGTTWTPSTPTYPTGTTTWEWSTTVPYSYDPGNLYWDGTLDTSWSGNLDNRTVTDPSATPGGAHYHIGNYYNWVAAAAMSIPRANTVYQQDVNQSICPAGWRLPIYEGNKSYNNLVEKQNLTAGTSGNIQKNPAYFVYSGLWLGSSHNVGVSGDYWSNTVDYDHVNLLSFEVNGRLYPQSVSNGVHGGSVRCVAR